jgi:acyl-CoA synthetase (AMP-forming)/AMP-acid ligase II
MELGLLLEMAAGDEPDRLAVTDVDGTTLTRGQVHDGARRAAARFRAAGATQVGYLATSGRALPITLFGAALAGLPFVPFNYRLSDEQLGELLHREPGLLVVATDETAKRLATLGITNVVAVDDVLAESTEIDDDLPYVDADEIAVMLYTSGTTSAPKAALLRHRHLTAYILSTVEFGSASTDDSVIVSVPPYHVAGVSTVLSNLYSGRRIVYLDPFDAERWLDLVRAEQVSHAMVVPTMLARIVDHLGDNHAVVPSLRSVAYGGAKMPAPVIERALHLFPDVAFTNAYGLTETSSTITVLGPEDHRSALHSDDPAVRARLDSAGQAVPGVELIVCDDFGEPCPPGTVGNVFVRGQQVSGEYVGSSALGDDGWFPTRDRGSLDPDGYLFIEGRSDDTIIRGGENIAPAEIEAVLLRHEAVSDCAVVGLPHPEWGQSIAAVVVLEAGSDASADELQSWVRDHLRSLKTPDLIDIRDALPYTDTGKLLRREIRASLTAADS